MGQIESNLGRGLCLAGVALILVFEFIFPTEGLYPDLDC